MDDPTFKSGNLLTPEEPVMNISEGRKDDQAGQITPVMGGLTQ